MTGPAATSRNSNPDPSVDLGTATDGRPHQSSSTSTTNRTRRTFKGTACLPDMAATASVTEPRVLAHTKGRLFPADAEPNTYAVTDTQFATDEWLHGQPIPDAIRDRLAPYNHVRIGSGYPDLVGVGLLEDDLLAIERIGDGSPLIAGEAKGDAGNRPPVVERGVL